MKPILFLFLLTPSLVFAQGTVIPGETFGDRQSGVELFASTIRGPSETFSDSATDSTLTNGTGIASIGIPEVLDDQGQSLLSTEGFLSARHCVVRNEGNFMRFIASANADLEFEKAAALSTDDVEIWGAASTSFTFEITGQPMPVSLEWDNYWPVGQSFEVQVTLSKEGDPVPIYEYPAPSGEPPAGKRVVTLLQTGVYSVEIFMDVPIRMSSPIEQDLVFQLTVGEQPETIPIPAMGDYTHPEVYSERSGDGILQVINPQILSEIPLGDGTTEVRVAATVENLRAAPWPEVQLDIPATVEGEPDLDVISLPPVFALAENEALPVPDEAVIIVADADLPAVRASLLDGSRFRLSGKQQLVFAYPVFLLTAGDFEDAPASSLTPNPTNLLSFPYAPVTPSGTIWLEWEPFYSEPYQVIITDDTPQLIFRTQGRDRILPILIGDVVLQGMDFQIITLDPDDAFNTGGYPIPLTKVMKEGQFLNQLVFEGHPEGIGVTEDPETRFTSNGLSLAGLFPAPVPFHFNRFEVSPGIEVSGSFGFSPKDLVVNFEMTNFQLEALEVTARYQADCNLLLETAEGADNSAEPIAGRETTLLDMQLLEINLSNGLTFAPRLVLEAGAVVTAPTSLSIPVTAGLDVMVMAGVRDGQPVYDSSFTPIPVQASKPGIFEAFFADALAYIDCEIKALFGASGNLFQSGPTLGARAEAGFSFRPLDDPWWTADAGFSIFAGAEFNLAGIVTLVDAEQDLGNWDLSPLFPLQADGPLFPAVTAQSVNPQPGFQPLGDLNTRWARSIQSDAAGEGVGPTEATLLAGGDLLASNRNLIARLSPAGELIWMVNRNLQLQPASVVAEADGGFTTLGVQNGLRIARFDSNGNVVWKKNYRGDSGVILTDSIDMVKRVSEGGASEYFVLGESLINSTYFAPTLVKLDNNGDFLWGRHFEVPPLGSESIRNHVTAIGITQSGDILLAGDTSADIQGVSQVGNITHNGLVIKVDGDTGDVIWTTLVAEADGPSYSAISEGPDGSIYVGGNSLQGVWSENPSLLLVKLNPDGSLLDSVLIGCAESSDTVPHDGESPFDEIFDMTWADGNLWVCGRIGLYNAGSGSIANGASAFTAMISEDLDVSRFVIHAGTSTDFLNSIETTPHGLFVTGYSRSFHPWPFGASGEADLTRGSLLAMMLPWEGRIRFHDISAGRQEPANALNPSSGSYFMTPRVRATSQFTIETNQSLYPGLAQDNLTLSASDSRLALATPFTPVENPLSYNPTFIDPFEFKSLEFLPESLITDLASYLQWWQVEGGEDGDADGLTTEMEFYLGTSGLIPDFGVIDFDTFIDADSGELNARFTFPRSFIAAPALPVVRAGNDLIQFDPREDVNAFAAPLDSRREEITLELPILGDREFYRLHFPE